jgi:four helix bundle protein
METKAKTKTFDLEKRSLEFAKEVRDFVRSLPKSLSAQEDGRQLIRSSGSIGANYIEANESLGKKDFLLRIKIARKEAKETHYWLELIDVGTDVKLSERRKALTDEAKELLMILSAMINKAQTHL